MSNLPQPPEGVLDPKHPWYTAKVGERTWKLLKARLTGTRMDDGTSYSSFVNLSETEADTLISNMKKDPQGYPQFNTTGGAKEYENLEKYQHWLVERYLEQTQVYKPEDKFVDDSKQFTNQIESDLQYGLQETSQNIMDSIDAFIEADRKRYEDFKNQLAKKTNHPKLYDNLQNINPRYMWGQNGLYDLEFKSDIDRAIYFAGKIGNNKKDSQIKKEVRDWLFSVTGLNVYDDYDEIKKYRQRILDFIKQLIQLKPQERSVIVPPIYDGYYQEPEEDDEEEEQDEEYNYDLYGKNLDNLLQETKNESNEENAKEEIQEQVNIAAEVLDEAENAKEEVETEKALEDIPDSIRNDLVKIINKRTGSSLPSAKKSDSSVSNAKIYNFLTTNLLKVQKQFESIDRTLQKQNDLLAANFASTSSMIQNIEMQNNMLGEKIDALAQEYQRQNQINEQLIQDKENAAAESRLKSTRDAAGTEGFVDTRGEGGGLFGVLARFLGKKLGRFIFNRLWKLLPRSMRARFRLGRMILGRTPRKIKAKLAQSIAQRVMPKVAQQTTSNVAQKVASKAAPTAIAKGFEHIALPGVTRNLNQVGKVIDQPAAKIAMDSMLGPGAKLVKDQLTKPESAMKIAMSALNNKKVQLAITKKAGKEVLEKVLAKLGIKVGGQAIPVFGQAINIGYGVIEAITRTAMGDPKGGLLSLGSAIPFAGAGFGVLDIIRDIDINAYTKHIEPNLMQITGGDGRPLKAFFNEVAGENLEYEVGTTNVKAKDATLHGTEWVGNKKEWQSFNQYQTESETARTLLGATLGFINQAGPAAASIVPVVKQLASPLIKEYGKPNVLVKSDTGGSFSSTPKVVANQVEDKEKELSPLEKMLASSNPEEIGKNLMNMLDPEGKLVSILSNLGNGNPPNNQPYTGPSYESTGGEKITRAEFGRGFRVKDGLGSGSTAFGHTGLDVGMPMGTPLSIVPPGVVVDASSGYNNGYGNLVAIKLDDGRYVKLNHLSEINVKNGDRVGVGSGKDGAVRVIGKVGSTGLSTGPHMHIDVGTGYDKGPAFITGLQDPSGFVLGGGVVKGGSVKASNPTATQPTPPPANTPTSNQQNQQSSLANRLASGLQTADRVIRDPIGSATRGIQGMLRGTQSSGHETSPELTGTDFQREDPPGALAPGQRPDKSLTREQFAIARRARSEGKSAGLTGRALEQHVAQSVMQGQALRLKAKGGPVEAKTPYMVGEKGPEMFVPNQKGSIVPNKEVAGLFGMFGGGSRGGFNPANSPYAKDLELERIKKTLPSGKGFTGKYDQFGNPTGYGANANKEEKFVASAPQINSADRLNNLKPNQKSMDKNIVIINNQNSQPQSVASANQMPLIIPMGSSSNNLKTIVMQRLMG